MIPLKSSWLRRLSWWYFILSSINTFRHKCCWPVCVYSYTDFGTETCMIYLKVMLTKRLDELNLNGKSWVRKCLNKTNTTQKRKWIYFRRSSLTWAWFHAPVIEKLCFTWLHWNGIINVRLWKMQKTGSLINDRYISFKLKTINVWNVVIFKSTYTRATNH